MMEKATSADVAARAGVSRSAVSRVFTHGASASKSTTFKVHQAAAELGYRPNALARSLLTGRSRIIGLVVAYLDNQFYPTAVEKLSTALQARGYHVLVFMAPKTMGDVEPVAREILDYQVDGLIFASVGVSSDLASLCQARGVPVVMFNRSQDGLDDCAVVSDNHQGGILAAQHLIKTGAKRIAYIAGWEGASTQQEREAGFVTELARNGRALCARGVGNFTEQDTIEATLLMFNSPNRPDAVFVANDHMAFIVMDVLRSQCGLRVPYDVAVIGFDDVPAAAWGAYNLTTVRQDTDMMVVTTVKQLIDVIGADLASALHTIPVQLVVRGSTQSS